MIGRRESAARVAHGRLRLAAGRSACVMLVSAAVCAIGFAGAANGLAANAAAAGSGPTVHGCPRAISYEKGKLRGGIYDFGHMTCRRARTVTRDELESHHVAGFRCGFVKPNRVEPEGAERCQSGRQFVVFGSE